MLNIFIELLAKGCLILLLVLLAIIFVTIAFAFILTIIDVFKKNKIKNDTLKAMMEELDKLEKK